MISEREAERLEGWIARAVARGARLLAGGPRRGALMPAHLLEGVPEDEPLACEEAFGPVALLAPFGRFEEALAAVNRSRYGLQAGVFTARLDHALAAWDRLEVGAVVVGDVPSTRLDAMPYGGVKDSGLGREGPRHAIAEYTEPRLLLIRG
ncbi:MAG: aldehyde dehydrogenase family protein [Xanthomonadales bacterium]|nr:aldehyde dehydrogenase family protein [Xanthomonadales bacterium]